MTATRFVRDVLVVIIAISVLAIWVVGLLRIVAVFT
jgi:hypothetical protein